MPELFVTKGLQRLLGECFLLDGPLFDDANGDDYVPISSGEAQRTWYPARFRESFAGHFLADVDRDSAVLYRHLVHRFLPRNNTQANDVRQSPEHFLVASQRTFAIDFSGHNIAFRSSTLSTITLVLGRDDRNPEASQNILNLVEYAGRW
jgi:hypothetical protein